MANAPHTNPAPIVLVGPTLTQRPGPKLLPLGTKFVNETSGEEYTIVRAGGAAAGAKTWALTSGGTSLPAFYKFAGGVSGAAGAVDVFVADNVPPASSATALKYIVPVAGTIRGLKVYVSANNLASATTAEVYVNGVATGISVAIGAGATGAFETAAEFDVTATDLIDLHFHAAAGSGGGNSLKASAIVHVA